MSTEPLEKKRAGEPLRLIDDSRSKNRPRKIEDFAGNPGSAGGVNSPPLAKGMLRPLGIPASGSPQQAAEHMN